MRQACLLCFVPPTGAYSTNRIFYQLIYLDQSTYHRYLWSLYLRLQNAEKIKNLMQHQQKFIFNNIVSRSDDICLCIECVCVCVCGILIHVLIDFSLTLISVCVGDVWVCVRVLVFLARTNLHASMSGCMCHAPVRKHERMHVSCDCIHALCAMLACMGSNLNLSPSCSTGWVCIVEPPI